MIKYYDGMRPSLFNLDSDINEKNNLYDNETIIGNELLNELENYLKNVNASFPLINPNYDPNIKANMKNKSH